MMIGWSSGRTIVSKMNIQFNTFAHEKGSKTHKTDAKTSSALKKNELLFVSLLPHQSFFFELSP